MKKQPPMIYVMGLPIETGGAWALSKATRDVGEAKIRYADLATCMRAAMITKDKALVESLQGRTLADTKGVVLKAKNSKRAAFSAGVPLKEILRHPPENAPRSVTFDCARAETEHVGGTMRPGFAFNYWKDERGAIYHSGLLPVQRQQLQAQRDVRRAYGYRENAAV